MNRVGLGLAVGAGYVLGRTKKMKMAFALGTLVAGKRMHLSPRALADLVSQQLQDNPQFKEIGDQVRQDLRGVGKAASGAMVERQIDALADRLHGRTAQVRDQLSGVAGQAADAGSDEEDGDEEPRDTDEEPRDTDEEPEGEYEENEGEYEEDESGREDEEPEHEEPGDEEPGDDGREDDGREDREGGAGRAEGGARERAKEAPARRTEEQRGRAKKAANS